MKEQVIQNQILQLCSRPHIRLFRINSGMVKSEGGYMFRGAPAGTSDILGWKVVDGVPVFVAIEVKLPGRLATPRQDQFLDSVRAAGGIAGVAHSPEEAMELLGLI